VVKDINSALEEIRAHEIVRWGPTKTATIGEFGSIPVVPCSSQVLRVEAILRARILSCLRAADLLGVIG
jgi:hypothetical protein